MNKNMLVVIILVLLTVYSLASNADTADANSPSLQEVIFAALSIVGVFGVISLITPALLGATVIIVFVSGVILLFGLNFFSLIAIVLIGILTINRVKNADGKQIDS